MKFLVVLGLVLVAAELIIADDASTGVVASIEPGFVSSTMAYEKFMQPTYNSK